MPSDNGSRSMGTATDATGNEVDSRSGAAGAEAADGGRQQDAHAQTAGTSAAAAETGPEEKKDECTQPRAACVEGIRERTRGAPLAARVVHKSIQSMSFSAREPPPELGSQNR